MPDPSNTQKEHNSVRRPPPSGIEHSGETVQPASGRTRWGRWLAAATVGLMLLLVFAPTLAGWSPLRHDIPRLRLRGYPGKIRVEGASLAWWSPIELRGVELAGPDDAPFVKARVYREERTVWQVLFERDDPPQLRVEGLEVSVRLRSDGSNAQDLLEPVLKARRRRPRDRTVEVVDGSLRLEDEVADHVQEWTGLKLHLQTSIAPHGTSALHIEATLADARGPIPFAVDSTWQNGDAGAATTAPPQTVQIGCHAVPLAGLSAALRRKVPGLDLAGSLSGTVHIHPADPSEKPAEPSSRVEVDLAVRNLDAVWPEHLGADRMAVPEVKLIGMASLGDARCDVSHFTMQSELGQLGVRGTFPLAPASDTPSDPVVRLAEAEFDVQGSVEIDRIVRLLPHTLRLHEGLEMRQGQVRFSSSASRQDNSPRWKGRLETTRLAATIDGKEVAWEQPIQLAFDVHRDHDRLAIDALTCDSDVAHLSGSGDSDQAHLTGQIDLDGLTERLGRFFNTEGVRLRGRLGLNLDARRTVEGRLAVVGEASTDDFEAAFGAGRPWTEPNLVARLECELVEKSLRLREIHSCRFTLHGEQETDQLTLSLLGPVSLGAPDRAANFDLRISGNLARWQPRLKPFDVVDGWTLSGDMQAQTRLGISRNGLAADALAADVRNLHLVGHDVDFTEPQARLTATATWDKSARRLTVAQLALDGAVATVGGTDIVLLLPENGASAVAGSLTLKTDLDRFNPPSEAPGAADVRPWSGRIQSEVAFVRDGEQTKGRWKVDIDDLSIRRQVTTQVERRRGDIERLEAPHIAIPQAPQGVRLDGRAQRELRKAQKEAEREQKKREKEYRKRADQIVFVPTTEWKTLWADKHLELSGAVRLDRATDSLAIEGVHLRSTGISLSASGQIAELSERAVLNISGDANYDLAQLLPRLEGRLARYIRVTGRGDRTFALSGPLRFADKPATHESGTAAKIQHAAAIEDRAVGPAATQRKVHQVATSGAERPIVPPELKAEAGIGWQGGDLFGLQAGAGELQVKLFEDVLSVQPLDMSLSGGRLKLAPRVLLAGRPATIVLPAGPMVEKVALSQELCDAWLKFIAPILAETTRVDGQFSLAMNETRLPIDDPLSGDLSGQLQIHAAQVLPGAMFARLAEVIGQVQSAIGAGARDVIGLDQPLVQITDQSVDFKLHERRLHHSPLAFYARNVLVRTRGSVGADQTLDLVAEIHFPAEWSARSGFLNRLAEKPLKIPIRGTLRHPDLDGTAIGRIAAEVGGSLLDGLLNGSLRGVFDRQD